MCLKVEIWGTPMDDLHLEGPFFEVGTRKAIWDLLQEKAHGPDGFPIFFFKRFWNFVKEDLIKLMKEVFKRPTQVDRLNYVTIVLISKKDKTKVIGDYRLTSLVNSSMKIISKVLANRLGPCSRIAYSRVSNRVHKK